MSEASIHLVGETTSTNELALTALSKGAQAGTVFVADCQREGRGRREVGGGRRQWFSPRGKNIYLSVLIRPQLEMERLSPITLAAGVGLARVLREESGADIWLKWPNDLYVGEKKLGGILTEAATGVSGLEGAVIGVGLNCNVKKEEFPEELQQSATSLLEETGEHQDRLSLALAMSEALLGICEEYVLSGLEGFAESLRQFDGLSGRVVEVREKNQARRGVARGIGMSGGLNVEFEDGEIREIIAGTVVVDGLGGHRL